MKIVAALRLLYSQTAFASVHCPQCGVVRSHSRMLVSNNSFKEGTDLHATSTTSFTGWLAFLRIGHGVVAEVWRNEGVHTWGRSGTCFTLGPLSHGAHVWPTLTRAVIPTPLILRVAANSSSTRHLRNGWLTPFEASCCASL